jgi:hypothetical protein
MFAAVACDMFTRSNTVYRISIGFLINSKDAVPSENIQNLQTECGNVYQNNYLTAKDFSTLLGQTFMFFKKIVFKKVLKSFRRVLKSKNSLKS